MSAPYIGRAARCREGNFMSKQPVGPVQHVLRAIGRFLAAIVVVAYALLDQLLFPLFRPLLNALARLRVFEAIGALLGRLPPYVVLVVLAVPFVVLEPLKVFALYWLALGHIVQGGVLLIIAHALSILTLERLYQAGKPQLMKIGWFARVMGWLGGIRDWAFGWVKSTAAWTWAAGFGRSVRAAVARLIAGIRRSAG
jgi:hypothetical protein